MIRYVLLYVYTLLQARCLSLVLLRRLITNEWLEIANELDAQTMHNFKEALLDAVQGSSLKLLQKRYADVVAEVARFSIGSDFALFTSTPMHALLLQMTRAASNSGRKCARE